jgi:amino acid adenylation domain-containing protein
VKAETKIDRHVALEIDDLAFQQTDSHQGYAQQDAIRAKCFHPTGTFIPFPEEDTEQSVPEQFEKIVRQYPDRIAVKTSDFLFTYADLNKAANRVAHEILQKLGDRTEPVLFLADHGPSSIIGFLGILKASKTLLAIDPTCPVERIAYIRNDSQATAILTDGPNLSSVRALTIPAFQVLNLDAMENNPSQQITNLNLAPDSPAEIRYSSGSTGKPKGMIRSHRRLLQSAMLTVNSEGHTCADDRLLAIQRLTFGCNVMLKGLLVGATLCPFDITKHGFADLSFFINQQEVTYYTSSPSTFRYFMSELGENENFPSVRVLQLGGDSLNSRDIEAYKKHFPGNCILMYQLGSSETGILCQYFIDKSTKIDTSFVPVGYPVEGKEILLLDDSGREVEFGQTGEIAVKSRFSFSEYLRRPELTSAKFISNDAEKNSRICLTGDLGRMLPDGRLVYLGRKDLEVKIRGCKVALPEVEATLCDFDGVVDAAVKAWKHESGESFLAAYLISRTDVRPNASELYTFLKTKLPEYMIPSSYMFLESFPLTNSKLDRSQLPLPEDKRPDLGHPYAPAHKEVERSLVQIWERILDVRPVGIHDDFFELGGHSLLASRLFIDIEKAFGKQLPLTTLFWARNVEQLARIIQHEEWSAPWSLMFPIQTSGSRPPFFWVYGETTDVLLPRYLGPDQPLYGLMHEARTGKRVLYRTIPEIAANHLKEIQKVQPKGPYYLGGFCFGGMVAFEIAQQLQKQGQEIAILFLVDPSALNSWRSRFEKTESFRSKISRHARSLAGIDVWEKFKYVYVRVRDRISGILGRGKNVALTVTRNVYFASGRFLPPLLREHYLSSVEHSAMRHYEPKMYPGDLILYKSEQKSYDPEWIAKFITGKLHLREVPSSHFDLLKEPTIALWAEELRSCLERAQSAQ